MQLKALDEDARYRAIKKIEENPELTQRELANELGISLGKVNYILKALIAVGWVKVDNFARSRSKAGYAYLLTPKGVVEKAKLTSKFLEAKQQQYIALQAEIEKLRDEVESEAPTRN